MSYEDSRCPCGEKKLPGTMLCDACVSALADRRVRGPARLEAASNSVR
jgi:hypothetical protein